MSTEFINDQWRLPNAWNGSESNVNKQSNYSMDFDGSTNTYINIPNFPFALMGTGISSTLSIWIKIDSSVTNNSIIFSQANGTSNRYSIYFDYLTTKVYFAPGTLVPPQPNGFSINFNQWYHFACVLDGTNAKFYANGNQVGSTTSYTPKNTNANMAIGRDAAYNSFNHKGQIDEVAIFNYALSSSQITTLYGSSSTGIGNPMSLSPKPVAYYPLGDQDAFNGSNYLVPNIAAQEDDGDIAASYSPYALDFDAASSDYIDAGDLSILSGVTEVSVSLWFNRDTTTNQILLDLKDGSSRIGLQLYLSSSIYFYVNNKSYVHPTSLSINQWYNLVYVFNGSGGTNADKLKMYLNGTELTGGTYSGTIDSAIGAFTSSMTSNIGRTASTAYFDGSLSNLSIWNTALTSAQVTELYNEAVPSNLNNHSAYSNLVSWWQLGSNSSFNTNWTVLDEKGNNNGTSVNMTEADIVNGVGSSANGLSSGMGGDEVIGDAPYSSSNSLSVNMDVLDRVTDTPS